MLKFRNDFHEKLCMAVLWTIGIVFLFAFGIVVSCIVGQSDQNLNLLGIKICGIMLCCIWILFFLSVFVFTKKVVVTKDKIAVKRWGRELWSLDSNDLKECRCFYICALYFTVPNARTMKFILKGIDDDYAMWKTKRSYYVRCSISLSVKNAKKMAEMGYNVNFTDYTDFFEL